MNQVLVNPNQVLDQVQQVLDQVPDGYWGGRNMKPDEYKTVRDLICWAHNLDSNCGGCPLCDLDSCRSQTPEAETVLIAFLGRRPEKYGEEEKEECRSDAAAKHRADMIVKDLRKVQAYCAGQQRGCRECAFYNSWEEECKFGSCPADWDLDYVGDFAEGISGKGGSKP